MTKERRFLLQIDVDAAEEDTLLADVLLVGADRRVERDKQGVVPLGGERRHEGVVVHATAAEHAGGARGDVGDFHGSIIPKPFQAVASLGGWGRKKLTRKPPLKTRTPVTPAA